MKYLAYISILFYLGVLYGQNFFEFGSIDRADFYFIGMSMARVLMALTLFKAFKHMATSFLLFMCIGDLINEVYLHGDISYFEISFGVIGIIYILSEKLWK